MLKKIAALSLVAALALPALTAGTENASARVRVGVGVGFGFGWPGYRPYYGYPYAYRPYAYRPYPYRAYPYRYRYVGGTHVQRCLARYRTYNPRTDLFYARPGVLARCRL